MLPMGRWEVPTRSHHPGCQVEVVAVSVGHRQQAWPELKLLQ